MSRVGSSDVDISRISRLLCGVCDNIGSFYLVSFQYHRSSVDVFPLLLRIGHTYLTHSYLLKDEDPPICIPCNSLLTVEHSCINFDIICQNFYTASNLKDLFHNIHHKRIISFIHAIGFSNKL